MMFALFQIKKPRHRAGLRLIQDEPDALPEMSRGNNNAAGNGNGGKRHYEHYIGKMGSVNKPHFLVLVRFEINY
jgi:hypothetical protein